MEEMKFYRYMDVTTSSGVRIDLHKYSLLRKTPKGYWIADYKKSFWMDDDFIEASKRWILKDSIKRFVYPTKEEALTSFIAQARQVQILKARLKDAEVAYGKALNKDFDNTVTRINLF